ncbi:hypothetical protein [Snodgrassella alvi]
MRFRYQENPENEIPNQAAGLIVPERVPNLPVYAFHSAGSSQNAGQNHN